VKRIALDGRVTRQLSVGMQAYTRELTERLPRVAPDFEFVIFREGGNFGWAEHVRLPLAIRAAKPDVTHFLSHYTPVLPVRPYIVTVHDLIHLLFPHYFKAKVRPYYGTVVRFVCARAARVITDDERTVEDLQRFLGVAPERVRVIPLGVDDRFLQTIEPERRERPYFLYAGNHRRHKDLRTLFEAWRALPDEYAVDLLVTGADDFGSAQYARSNRRVMALGELSVEQLARYYAGAVALVHPALREGFGFPMLEAAAARTPVIACSEALPGVLRGAALTFPASDATAASEAMRRVLTDEGLRTKLVNEGRARAEAWTWDRCARSTAEVYREVLEDSKR
jgi:glycosyltransferase involved in cell wall biosynthesis